MDGESATCLVCHSSKKQLICPLCASNAINTDISSFRELRGATHRRLGLERQLQASLDRQERMQVNFGQLGNLKACILVAKQRARLASKKTLEVQSKLEAAQKDLMHRRQELQRAREKEQVDQLAFSRHAAAEAKQKLLHSHLLQEQVALELRKQAKLLYGVLPFRVNLAKPQGSATEADRAAVPPVAAASSSSRPLQVSVAGCPLPETLDVPPGANRQKLSTALGNLVMLMEVLSGMLHAPLLHRLHFCGSTSKLWQPRSFWEDKRARSGPVFRLYYATTLPAPSAPQGPPAAESLAGNALAAVKQRWPFDAGFSRTAKAVTPRVSVSDSRQEEDLRAAMLQLNRSAGLLCRDELLNQLGLAPQEWPPFPTLAGFCMQLAAHPRADGRRSMTASMAAPPSQREVERSVLVDSFDMDGEDDDEEIDGWDVIQRPQAWSGAASLQQTGDALPPRPSETEDVITHWERAMIIDSSDRSVTKAYAHRLLLGQIAPLRQGAYAAADRLWQGFRRSS